MFNPFKFIATLFGFLAAMAAIYFKGRQEGKKENREKQNEKTREFIEKNLEIRYDVERLSDDELDSELQKWKK